MGNSIINDNLNIKILNSYHGYEGGNTVDSINKQQRSRTAVSRNVRVAPEFRKEPDIEKLGQMFLMLARSLAVKDM